MDEPQFIAHQSGQGQWQVWQQTESAGRLIADRVASAQWAEAMAEWANGLDTLPGDEETQQGE